MKASITFFSCGCVAASTNISVYRQHYSAASQELEPFGFDQGRAREEIRQLRRAWSNALDISKARFRASIRADFLLLSMRGDADVGPGIEIDT